MVKYLGRDWNRGQILERVGRMDQLAGIRSVVSSDGPGAGIRSMEVTTGGGLDFRVLSDKALDVSACRFRGVPVCWQSPVGEVHPAYYESDGLGFLRTLQGGLFFTGGLDHFGAPSDRGGTRKGLHGRIGHTPASNVSKRMRWAGDDYLLEIEGEVRQAALFGENLVLRRRITTALGATWFEIDDQVTNEGFEPSTHMMLYHFNVGFPLLNEHSELSLNASAMDVVSGPDPDDLRCMGEPVHGAEEVVVRHRLAAGSERVSAEIVNDQLGIAMRLLFSSDELPYLFEWRMRRQGVYALGIEPANSSNIDGQIGSAGIAEKLMLSPGATKAYHLRVEFEEGTHDMGSKRVDDE